MGLILIYRTAPVRQPLSVLADLPVDWRINGTKLSITFKVGIGLLMNKISILTVSKKPTYYEAEIQNNITEQMTFK